MFWEHIGSYPKWTKHISPGPHFSADYKSGVPKLAHLLIGLQNAKNTKKHQHFLWQCRMNPHQLWWEDMHQNQIFKEIMNLDTEIVDHACGTHNTQNSTWGMGSRWGDLHQLGWFNLCWDWIFKEILNLQREIWNSQNSNCYYQISDGWLKITWPKGVVSGPIFQGDSKSGLRIFIADQHLIQQPKQCRGSGYQDRVRWPPPTGFIQLVSGPIFWGDSESELRTFIAALQSEI